MKNNRKDALECGDIYYFTGKPCKKGHVSKRISGSGSCYECSLNGFRNRYNSNIEESRRRNIERDRKSRQNEEKYKSLVEGRNKRRSEKRSKNIDEAREKGREAYIRYMDTFKINAKIRKIRTKGAEGKFTKNDIKRMFDEQKGICPYCNEDITEEYHIEHKTPISRGGSNWPENLHLTCAPCNYKKKTLTHEEFIDKLEREKRKHEYAIDAEAADDDSDSPSVSTGSCR